MTHGDVITGGKTPSIAADRIAGQHTPIRQSAKNGLTGSVIDVKPAFGFVEGQSETGVPQKIRLHFRDKHSNLVAAQRHGGISSRTLCRTRVH
jgi:hypothetical protein